MYSRADLTEHLKEMKVDPKGVLLVHSSMKSIGDVEGRADTVLDALTDYMKDGILAFPTLTWASVNRQHPVMDAKNEPACTGILPTLFLKRENVFRALHPTHSIAACGKNAKEFVAGCEEWTTPCPRNGCWGKLLDMDAQILFIGCRLTCNTFLHGVEEWCNVPNRLETEAQSFTVIDTEGKAHSVIQYRHNDTHPSQYYGKMEKFFADEQAIRYVRFGDAQCIIGSAKKMYEITKRELEACPDFFGHAMNRPAQE